MEPGRLMLNHCGLIFVHAQINLKMKERKFPKVDLESKFSLINENKSFSVVFVIFEKSKSWTSSSLFIFLEHLESFVSFTKDQILTTLALVTTRPHYRYMQFVSDFLYEFLFFMFT